MEGVAGVLGHNLSLAVVTGWRVSERAMMGCRGCCLAPCERSFGG